MSKKKKLSEKHKRRIKESSIKFRQKMTPKERKEKFGNPGSKNSIELEELFSLIRNYNKEWEEQEMCLKAIKKYNKGGLQVQRGGKS
jgi:hypothetical protein